eukprot:14069708-Alexandrium_andersonii.AAC.1
MPRGPHGPREAHRRAPQEFGGGGGRPHRGPVRARERGEDTGRGTARVQRPAWPRATGRGSPHARAAHSQ